MVQRGEPPRCLGGRNRTAQASDWNAYRLVGGSNSKIVERKKKEDQEPWVTVQSNAFELFWESEEMGLRVKRALEHAIKLTGGKVEGPQPAPKEPF